MIDAHAHLDRYGENLPRALEQIRALSIRTLGVSMDVSSFCETLRIAAAEPLIVPAFGVHPWEAFRFASDLTQLDGSVEEALAIGEIGLDYHFVKDESRFEAQRIVFEFFLDAAERSGKLINVHTKGAESAVLDSLRKRELQAVIVHWYSGPPELVDDFLDLGVYFTVGVEILHSDLIREVAAKLPADRLLTETDNPGAWEWIAGEIGYPDLVGKVEEALATINGVSRAELSGQVEQNSLQILGAGGVNLVAG